MSALLPTIRALAALGLARDIHLAAEGRRALPDRARSRTG
jgi:hypothetical protein